jgi:hypothetical protein
MEKIYIVTSGCSFTDSHIRESSNKKNTILRSFFEHPLKHDVVTNQSYRYQNFLTYELYKKNIEFEHYNVAMGSAGNHIIKNLYFEKINELLNNNINPDQIYGTIQLSGLYRPTDCADGFKKYNEWIYDYFESNLFNEKSNYKNLLEKHIDNINDIISFSKEKNIKTKIFWGWANFTKTELKEYDVYEKFENIDKDYLINFDFNENYDTAMTTPTNGFNWLTKQFNKILNKDVWKIEADKYGGMMEIVREFKNENQYVYMTEWDVHLNSTGNYLFYKNFYRKLFENWNILSNDCLYDNPKYKTHLEKTFEICSLHYIDSINNKPNFENNLYQDKKRSEYFIKFFQ